MTDKRYMLDEGLIYDNGKEMEDVVDVLNEYAEENEQLKRQVGNLEHTRDFVGDVCADCERLEKENEQLKQENQSWLKTASYLDTIAHEDRDYAKRMHKENEQLKQQVNCHKSRIQLLSPLLDLADTIIDLSDDEKAKAFWEKRNNEVEQEWNKILKGDVE